MPILLIPALIGICFAEKLYGFSDIFALLVRKFFNIGFDTFKKNINVIIRNILCKCIGGNA